MKIVLFVLAVTLFGCVLLAGATFINKPCNHRPAKMVGRLKGQVKFITYLQSDQKYPSFPPDLSLMKPRAILVDQIEILEEPCDY